MVSLNVQPAEKSVQRDDGAVDVVEIYPTIQGEGPHAGVPAVFVRTAACNLQCPSCDTDYTSNRELLTPQRVRQLVDDAAGKKTNLVVVTGGEPFRQDLSRLFAELCAPEQPSARRFKIQVETNGILLDERAARLVKQYAVDVVCSPKTPKVGPFASQCVDAWKYIVTAGEVDQFDGLPTSSLGMSGRPYRPDHYDVSTIYVQPCDDKDPDKNKANADAAVASCLKYGYRFCAQIHKAVNLP